MYSFVNIVPAWSNATLIMTMDASREMLLIPDNTYPKIGRFIGVPNVRKGDCKIFIQNAASLYIV